MFLSSLLIDLGTILIAPDPDGCGCATSIMSISVFAWRFRPHQRKSDDEHFFKPFSPEDFGKDKSMSSAPVTPAFSFASTRARRPGRDSRPIGGKARLGLCLSKCPVSAGRSRRGKGIRTGFCGGQEASIPVGGKSHAETIAAFT